MQSTGKSILIMVAATTAVAIACVAIVRSGPVVFFISMWLAVALIVRRVARTVLPPRVAHAMAWVLVLYFVWVASRAWLSFQLGHRNWLTDENYVYGDLYAFVAFVFATLGGADLAHGGRLYFLGPASRLLAVSFALRGAIALTAIIATKVHGSFVVLMLLGHAAALFLPRQTEQLLIGAQGVP